MPELRRDPFSGGWVVIATERQMRPDDFATRTDAAADPQDTVERCPFCPGHEARTPAEVDALRPAGAGPSEWTVRIVPNKYPAMAGVRPGGAGQLVVPAGCERRAAVGHHEVVVAAPQHRAHLADLPVNQLADVLRLCQQRMRQLLAEPSARYVSLFHNDGAAAGASRTHPHLQLVSEPVVPAGVSARAAALAAVGQQDDATAAGDAVGCGVCRLLAGEVAAGERLVDVGDALVTWVPFAARLPYAMLLAPRVHATDFLATDAGSLAVQLHRALVALRQTVGQVPYNLVLLHAPPQAGLAQPFDWHIEILPRLVTRAGLEWGGGPSINPVAPEAAAAALRHVVPR